MYVWLFHGPFHNRSSTRDSSGDFYLLLAAIPSFPLFNEWGFSLRSFSGFQSRVPPFSSPHSTEQVFVHATFISLTLASSFCPHTHHHYPPTPRHVIYFVLPTVNISPFTALG